MTIRAEYAGLVVGSKMGAGLQGQTDRDRLDATVDRLLVLDHDIAFYCGRFGSRCFVRTMHDSTNWKDPHEHARAIAPLMAETRRLYGVRDFLTENEKIALEGLGDSRADYEWYNWWLLQFLPFLRGELDARGAGDIRLWGPALTPGHQEDDGFEGYRILAPALRLFDGIAVHNYWGIDYGWIGQSDAGWWSQRIVRAHALIEGQLGIVKPWIISEHNRKVDRGSAADIAAYAAQCKRLYQFHNSLDYVVGSFTFLYCNTDPAFADLTWEQMPGMVEQMQDFDRQSTGEFTPTPEVPTMDAYERVRDWADLFVRESRIHGVPPSVTAAIMVIESGGDPQAESPMNYIGGDAIGTAKGLMQVMPFHFVDGEDPFDPQTNIRVGVRILAAGLARWGTWEQSAAAYFGAVDEAGNITGATDATGTSGNRYVAMWAAARQRFLDLDIEETAEVPIDKAAILRLLDDCWGSTNRLEEAAHKTLADAARIKTQIIAIKAAAGIEP